MVPRGVLCLQGSPEHVTFLVQKIALLFFQKVLLSNSEETFLRGPLHHVSTCPSKGKQKECNLQEQLTLTQIYPWTLGKVTFSMGRIPAENQVSFKKGDSKKGDWGRCCQCPAHGHLLSPLHRKASLTTNPSDPWLEGFLLGTNLYAMHRTIQKYQN